MFSFKGAQGVTPSSHLAWKSAQKGRDELAQSAQAENVANDATNESPSDIEQYAKGGQRPGEEPVLADYNMHTRGAKFARKLPGLVSWGVLIFGFVGPFVATTAFLVWACVYTFLFAVTLLPICFYLWKACYRIYRENQREMPEVSLSGPPYFAFVITTYKDDIELLATTLNNLAVMPMAAEKFIIVLATEGRDPEGAEKALALEQRFQGQFRHFTHSVHAAGIPGECAGKASNATAAGKHLSKEIRRIGMDSHEVIVTVTDSDILISERYIRLVEEEVNQRESMHHTMYAPYMSFYNTENDDSVPRVNALYDQMWAGMLAGNLARTPLTFNVKSPCSTYSLSLLTLEEMGYWETGDVGIGEDYHTALRLHFTYNGKADYVFIPAPFKASHVGGDTFTQAYNNRLQQAKRHFMGCQDIGYVLQRVSKQWRQLGVFSCFNLIWTTVETFAHFTLSVPTTFIGLSLAGLWIMFIGCGWENEADNASICVTDSDWDTYQWWVLLIGLVGQVMGGIIGATIVPCVEYLNFNNTDRTAKQWAWGLLTKWIWAPLLAPIGFFPAMHAATEIMIGRKIVYKAARKVVLDVSKADADQKPAAVEMAAREDGADDVSTHDSSASTPETESRGTEVDAPAV